MLYQSLFAQTDDCATATVITPNDASCSYQNGTSSGATQSLAGCSGTADDDVWYQFVANSSEMHIKVNPSDLYDPVIQLYSGSCGTLSSITCEDVGADGETEELLATGLTPGNTYFIRVYDFGAGSGSDDFSICVFGVPSPTNDTPCSATALPEVTPSCNMGTYTTIGATDSGEPAPGTCGSVGYSGGDIWFTAVVPSNGEIEISFQEGVMLDGVVAIYSGTCGVLSLITCDDDSGINNMPYLYQTGLTPGATIWIRVWEFNNDNPGTFDMCVSSPTNDDCANSSFICDFNGYGGITSGQYTADRPGTGAGQMYGNGETSAGVFLGNTNTVHSGGPLGYANGTSPSGFYNVSIENNSWITFVANAPTAVLDVEVEYCENGDGMQMQIFSGSGCDNFAAVSNFVQTTSSQQLTATGLTVGQTYYIMIDGFAGDICNYTITAESGVQVVDITSSNGTSVCNGQTSELTVEADGATSYSWSASPGGSFGTGLQTETVTVTTTTVYTVTVTGFCDASETASITITPDKVVNVDFYATDLAVTATFPVPATMNCDDDAIYLWAEDSSAAGGYITPSLTFIFTSDNFATIDNTSITIYEDGIPIYVESPIADNTILTVWGEYLSPTSAYTFDLCDNFGDGGLDWEVYDGNTGAQLGSGTMVSGFPCETFGPFSPVGNATWSITPVSGALLQADWGLGYFDPAVASVGSFDITYTWDNTVGCAGFETKTIDVVNLHDASWNAPGAICSNSGLLDLTTLIDAAATSTSGTWSGTGVSGTDFDPSGLSGPISVTYTVGTGAGCEDAVAHNITVTSIPTASSTSTQVCEDSFGSGTASGINLTSFESTMDGGLGFTFSWYSDVGLTSAVGTPNSVTATNNEIYYASITDGTCATTENITISVASIPSITVSSTSVTCNGDADGTVSVAATGGPAAYTYLWNPPAGNTNPSIIGLSPNTYNVTVTSGVCENSGSTTISEPTNVIASISGSVSVTCNGASSGTANASGSGGNGAPYSFNWSTTPAQNTSTATGLAAGVTYSVTVADQFGSCFDVTTVSLAEPATSVTASISGSTSVTCNGGSNGSATASGVGGNGAPFTYNWNTVPVQTSQTATGLSAGSTYFVTVTDASGTCSDITSITVAEPTAVSVNFTATSDASCASGTDGQTTANGSGGAGGYTFQWNIAAGSQTTSTATGLNPGTYSVTVTDALTCEGIGTVTISNTNTFPVATITTPSQLNCINTTITLDASGSTGTGTLTYNWSTAGGNIVSGGNTDSPDINLPGTYTVTVTDGASGCTDTDAIVVSQDVTIPTTTITACNNTTSVGGSDGSISVAVGTAPGPYTYGWSPAPALGQTAATATGLSASSYNVTVTASNGCSASDGCTVNDPGCLVTVSITTVTNVSCNGGTDGQAAVQMTGGTGTSWTYNWINGQVNQTTTGLTQGSYGVTVTDNNGCVGSTSVNITQPAVLGVSSSVNQQVNCNGESNGSASISVIGGTTLYTYNWSNGFSNSTETALVAGVYSVTVIDANTCNDVTSLTITEPQVLTVIPTCNSTSVAGGSDGSSSVSVSGGDSNYTYSWSNGSTTSSATGLSSGIVSVTITDGNLCIVTSTCNISDPGCAVTISTTLTSVTCNGGTDGQIIASASGGVMPYNFIWSDGQTGQTATGLGSGNITVSVTDGAVCTDNSLISISEPSIIQPNMTCSPTTVAGASNGSSTTAANGGTGGYTYQWSNGATTSGVSGVPAGTYTVTVTDASTCSVTATCDVVDAGCALGVNTTPTNSSCNGSSDGSVSTSLSGGITPYTYSWSDGQTTANATGLAAGSISVTITDGGACIAMDAVTITEPAQLSVTNVSTIDAVCTPGNASAAVTVTGGLGSGYTYFWDDGQTTSLATALSDGQHCVTIADAMNATCAKPYCVTVSVIPGPTLSVTDISLLCNGDCNGISTTTVTDNGGSTFFNYSWSDGQTNNSATGLCAGNYSLTVTDGNNCTVTDALVVSEPSALTLTTAGSSVCFGMSDGTTIASLTGGVTPYNYLWDSVVNIATQSGLSGGSYEVAATDGNSCTELATVTVGVDPLPTANDVTDALCETVFGTSITNAVDLTSYESTINGGAMTYTWFQSDQTTPVVNPSGEDIFNAESFFVVVNDGTCQDSAQVDISVLQGASVSVSGGGLVCTDSSNPVSVTFMFGGNAPYSFTYVYNQDSTTINNYSASSYTISTNIGGAGVYNVINLIGANGCSNSSISDTIEVEAVGPVADFIPDIDNGDPPLEVNFTNNSTFNNGEFYDWSFGDGSESTEFEPQHVYTEGGDYEVVLAVIDILGCTDTAFYQYVIVSNESAFLIPVVFSPNGDGVNDDFHVTGYNLESVEGEIYNRWGERVYILDGTKQGWDGRTFAGSLAPEGTYFVILNITGSDGVLYDTYTGNLTLIR